MSAKFLIKKNYLAMIENAAKGENWMFRNLYAEVDGREIDIANNGRWSCAIFVSWILYLNKLIGDMHANVESTEKDMIANRWFEIKDLKPGSILIWEKKIASDDNQLHSHVGFYVGSEMAVSNDSKKTCFPIKHHHTYNGTRKIEKIYWHLELND